MSSNGMMPFAQPLREVATRRMPWSTVCPEALWDVSGAGTRIPGSSEPSSPNANVMTT